MGLLATIVGLFDQILSTQPTWLIVFLAVTILFSLAVAINVLNQLLFKNPNEPPVVFHWIPVIGSTIAYGIDPFKFFFACREKVGVTSVRSYGRNLAKL